MPDNKPKKSYVISIEGTVPISVQYRVMAEDEDQAIEQFKKGYAQLESQPKIDHRKITKRKVLVRNSVSFLTKSYPPF